MKRSQKSKKNETAGLFKKPTMKLNTRGPKAYKDPGFLTSADAREIRLLAEYAYPLSQLRRNKIKNTIVFFGSARIKSPYEVLLQEKELNERKKKLKPSERTHAEEQVAVMKEMSVYYTDAYVLAKRLTEWAQSFERDGRFVISSGGGPGIMEAANRGAFAAGGMSIGFNISLPFEQYPNPYITPELNFEFHYFFMRKFWFVYLSKAVVMFPGGFGTMDEMMEVLTLLQTQKIRKHITVVLYGKRYWSKILNFEALVKYGMISREDLHLFEFADSPEEAFSRITKSLKKNYIRGKKVY